MILQHIQAEWFAQATAEAKGSTEVNSVFTIRLLVEKLPKIFQPQAHLLYMFKNISWISNLPVALNNLISDDTDHSYYWNGKNKKLFNTFNGKFVENVSSICKTT